MSAWYYLAVVFREPMLILLVALGTCAGVYVGAIPGLSGTMAVSLLVSFTFGWETHTALAVMIGVFVGAVFGGSRSAILLNIPGAPAAVATSLDGYKLAQQGKAGQAMGISTTQSVIGTLLGVVVLATCAPLVAKMAMNFHSVDYLMLAIMGLMMVGSLCARSVKFGLIAGAMGIFLGCVGVDAQTAVKRFTFGIVYLNSGVDYVVAMIGLFGASEALIQLSDMSTNPVKQKVDKIIPSWSESVKHLPLTIRSAVIGVLVGALPGAGGDIAALLSYDQAKRGAKNPEVPFGEGNVEGIIAPETANNAAIGGAFIPMLTMGIPGDAVTAVIISALTIHGLRPGPNLITNTPDLFWLIVSCLFLASIFLLLFGLTGIKVFTKIVEVPKAILMPIIMILSVIGAYAIRNSVFDIFWMFAFGIIGYFLKRYNYPIAPIVLGIILTTLFETNYRRGVMLEGSIPGMLASIFTSPISIVLFLLIVILSVTQTGWYKNWKVSRDEKLFARKNKV
ncbi:tripartite tricarboxylate transporter family protein [Oscillibacter valericigenes Sjm18-20]|nr:tripartite tricarboxylate transporter family protein [Oscillibacter valericigenes Sjm18-20]